MVAARRRCRSIRPALVAVTASIGLWQVADVAFGVLVRGCHFGTQSPVAAQRSDRLRRFVTRATANSVYAEGIALMDQGRAPQEKILEGLQKITQAGVDGSMEAQANLAFIYWNGALGLPKDQPLAITWWERAAAQGDAGSHYNLGLAKLFGNGISMNKFEAGKSFRAAAEAGSTEAMTTLATMLHKGDGIPQDTMLACEWMIKAATAQGDDLTDILSKLETGDLTKEQRIQLSDKIDELGRKNKEKNIIISTDTSSPRDEWDDDRGQV